MDQIKNFDDGRAKYIRLQVEKTSRRLNYWKIRKLVYLTPFH